MQDSVILTEVLPDGGGERDHPLSTPKGDGDLCYHVAANGGIHEMSQAEERDSPISSRTGLSLYVSRYHIVRVEAFSSGIYLVPPHVARQNLKRKYLKGYEIPPTVDESRTTALLRHEDQLLLKDGRRFTVHIPELLEEQDVQVDSSQVGEALDSLADRIADHEDEPLRDTPVLLEARKLVQETPALDNRHRDALASFNTNSNTNEEERSVSEREAVVLEQGNLSFVDETQQSYLVASQPPLSLAHIELRGRRESSQELMGPADLSQDEESPKPRIMPSLVVSDSFHISRTDPRNAEMLETALQAMGGEESERPEDKVDRIPPSAGPGSAAFTEERTEKRSSADVDEHEEEEATVESTSNGTRPGNSTYLTPMGSVREGSPAQESNTSEQKLTENHSTLPAQVEEVPRKRKRSEAPLESRASPAKRSRSIKSKSQDSTHDSIDEETIVVRVPPRSKASKVQEVMEVIDSDISIPKRPARRGRKPLAPRAIPSESPAPSTPAEASPAVATPTAADKGLRVLFSHARITSKPAQMKRLRAMGIETVDKPSPESFDILVIGEVRKSFKLLMSIVAGKQIVEENWLTQCIEAEGVLPTDSFIPRDMQKEKEWSFSMSKAAGVDRHQLFRGYSFCLTPSLKRDYGADGFRDIETLIRSAGASDVSVLPARDHLRGSEDVDRVILGLEHGDIDAATLVEHAWVCYTKDLVSTSILRNSFDVADDEFKITMPKSQQDQQRRGRRSKNG